MSRKALAEPAAAQSQNYRAGGGAQGVRSREDPLASAFPWMPAPYAWPVAVFDALRRACDLEPRSLFDVGAGPGTAAFAAVQAFDTLAEIRLVETNIEMQRLGSELLAEASNPTLRAAA